MPFSDLVVGPGQKPGMDVPFLYHAAGTKNGFGGPDPAHSVYEEIQFDENGSELVGATGTFSVTTTEPPVNGFWSVTVYDTARGGFLHPNEHDKYHVNDTLAARNTDGSVTLESRQSCKYGEVNCLEVPSGHFEVVARYYLPRAEILSGEWIFPGIRLDRAPRE